jgi:hypothetical protein
MSGRQPADAHIVRLFGTRDDPATRRLLVASDEQSIRTAMEKSLETHAVLDRTSLHFSDQAH